MGAVAADLADRIVLTDDNPRSEDPARDRRATFARASREHPRVSVIHDRRTALTVAIERARPGDVVRVVE